MNAGGASEAQQNIRGDVTKRKASLLERDPTAIAGNVSARPDVFSGWKEIANYMGKGVRTVQRYERDMQLPIHRPGGRSSRKQGGDSR